MVGQAQRGNFLMRCTPMRIALEFIARTILDFIGIGLPLEPDQSLYSTVIMRFDPDSDQLPSRNSLPSIEGAPFGAAWFWGEEDQVYEVPVDVVLTGADRVLDRPLKSPYTAAHLFFCETRYPRRGGESQVFDNSQQSSV